MASRTAKVGIAKSPSTCTVVVPDVPEVFPVDILTELGKAFPPANRANVAHGLHLKNQHGYRGLRYEKSRTKPWRATIVVNKKCKHLGYRATKEEAARDYDKAAKIIYGEHAVLNFPDD